MLSSAVKKIKARQVIDSRGNPTVEAEVSLESGHVGRASVPSGASTGKGEAIELRDGDPTKFHGRGVEKAVANINQVLAEKLAGFDSLDQRTIDQKMIELDGTPQKAKLGANAILAVSIANAKAAAVHSGLPLYKYLSEGGVAIVLPVPLMNVINGGKHAGNELSIQEFILIPAGFDEFPEALRASVEIYDQLKSILRNKYGPIAINVGDEGGFAPPLKFTPEALNVLVKAIEESGYDGQREVVLGLDCASGSFFDEKDNRYHIDQKTLAGPDLIDYYGQLLESYNLRSIEDPFCEDDPDNFALFTKKHHDIQVIGDDIFVTNKKRLEAGISRGIANTLLFKVNQIGTLTEAFETMHLALQNRYRVVVSHRSGETEDDYIADIAVGKATGQIKTGAPARGERTAKYNRLLRIYDQEREKATYPGEELFIV